MRIKFYLFMAVVMTVLLGACAPEKKIPGGTDVRADARANALDPQVERVNGSWTPARIHLSCVGDHCKPQVGMLVASKRIDARNIDIKRCTAALIAPDRVLTSGHCVLDGLETHFVLPGGFRRVIKVELNTRAGATDQTPLGPDIAVLKLESPFENVVPLTAATGSKPNFKSLKALVVNASAEADQYRIDPLTCAIRRHELFYPFDMSENPDQIYGFDCHVVRGNSGGPMFAGDGDTIEAVVQAFIDPADVIKSIPQPTPAWAKHWISIATNPRCFAITEDGASPCLPINEELIKERAQKLTDRVHARVTRLGDRERSNFPTAATVERLNLRDKIDGHDAFETIDNPTCVRAADPKLDELKFMSELILTERDEWARPRLTVADRRVTVGRVTSQYHDTDGQHHYKVEVNWPAPFGTLQTPERHPSLRRGSPFKIDLPGCPR